MKSVHKKKKKNSLIKYGIFCRAYTLEGIKYYCINMSYAETRISNVYVCVCVSVMYQKKVTKLVVHIGDGDEEDRDRQQVDSGVEPESPIVPRPTGTCGGSRPDKLVRVCSWSDRRDSGGGGGGGIGGYLKSSIPSKSADDLQQCAMPSVKELAKQFSSNVSSL